MNFKHNNYTIEFTEDCKDEIKEIFEYISNSLVAKKAANELMQKMKKSIYNLAKYPKIYVKISKTDKRHRDFRKMGHSTL